MTDSPAKLSPPPTWRLWENPIFRRYTRSRLRLKALFPALLLTLIFSTFFFLITVLVSKREDESRRSRMQAMEERAKRSTSTKVFIDGLTKTLEKNSKHDPAAKESLEKIQEQLRQQERLAWQPRSPEMHYRVGLIPLLIIQALILFFLGTGQVAGGMTSERDDGMVDYQRLVPMTPLAKTLGYLIGLPIREWVMFLSTLPFTAFALWRGEVAPSQWLPIALIFFTSVILYHLTGLVAGTVLKNRRWAFLLCMGLIFVLYILVPQGSHIGLPFLRYITMWPALMESAHLLPKEVVRIWAGVSGDVPGDESVKFFEWNFTAVAFTLLVQGSFIVTMLVMVWRKWRQADSHLMSKAWALLVFGWLCILPLGTSLDAIEDGTLFPAKSLRQIIRGEDKPTLDEAIAICGFYGQLMLLSLVILVILLTPVAETQARGLRRAAKLKQRAAPFFADASSAFISVLVLVLFATISWTFFVRRVLGSRWFTADPGWTIGIVFFGILAASVVGLQTMLESRGGKWPFLLIVFLGIVPVLTSLVIVASRGGETAAVIVGGASPLAQPFYVMEQIVPLKIRGPIPTSVHNSARIALYVWPALYAAGAIQGMISLRRHWKRLRKTGGSPDAPPAATPVPPPLPS